MNKFISPCNKILVIFFHAAVLNVFFLFPIHSIFETINKLVAKAFYIFFDVISCNMTIYPVEVYGCKYTHHWMSLISKSLQKVFHIYFIYCNSRNSDKTHIPRCHKVVLNTTYDMDHMLHK